MPLRRRTWLCQWLTTAGSISCRRSWDWVRRIGSNARGVIVGLTRGTTKAHLARAALEAIAYQTADVLDAMRQDSGVTMQSLRVDGGATANDWLMQFQSDVLGVSVRRPQVQETTALGAAYLAGLATGVWSDLSDVAKNWQLKREFAPAMPSSQSTSLLKQWHRAVERSRGSE